MVRQITYNIIFHLKKFENISTFVRNKWINNTFIFVTWVIYLNKLMLWLTIVYYIITSRSIVSEKILNKRLINKFNRIIVLSDVIDI